jgi:hypothetical protein
MRQLIKPSQFAAASIALAGGFAVAAIAGPAVADPMVTFDTFIAVPADTANMQPGGAFSSFDISFADPATGNIFIADRSNAAVDIFSGSSQTFLGRATGFTGQQATTSVSGPDGVLTVTSGGITTLYGGDGNSTLRVYNATNPASPSLLPPPISTGGMFRVDEMAYSPTSHQVLAANNADSPAFGSLFSTTSGHPPVALSVSPITIPGQIASGGLEQPVWNPNTGTFFISVPTFNGSDPGGVAEINVSGAVLRTFHFDALSGGSITSCSPTGLALGASGNLMVGCGNAVSTGAAAVLLKPGTTGDGSIVKTFAGLAGTDELWYDPTTNAFYVTGNGGTNTTRFFDIVTDALA